MTEANDNAPLPGPDIMTVGVPSGGAHVAGDVGWPVRQSRSPRLHGYWLRYHGLDGAYVPFAVPPDGITAALTALPVLGIRGVNVTIPYKEAAFGLCTTVTDRARRIGAVNTVVVRNGQLHGDNTDGFGFLENLRQGAPTWTATQGPAVILGAGGAARAVCAALLDAGAPELRVLNRTVARAETIARDLAGPIHCASLDDAHLACREASLIVNTTSMGMDGQPPLIVDLDLAPPDALVTDLVYTPLETPLLSQARRRGHPVVDGLGMLLHQARPGFEAWFGVLPEVTDDLRRAVLDDGAA